MVGSNGLASGNGDSEDLVGDYGLEGRGVLSGFSHHPVKVVPDDGWVVVAGYALEFVGPVELLAVVRLEFLGVFIRVVAGGFLDMGGGLCQHWFKSGSHSAASLSASYLRFTLGVEKVEFIRAVTLTLPFQERPVPAATGNE